MIDIDRLDKTIAKQLNMSRSAARQLIRSGAVELRGEKVFDAQEQLDPNCDELRVHGEVIALKEYLYIMLNKPPGVLSAARDAGCTTVIDLLPPELRRRGLFPAGRLDKDTTGLLIITDDGDFAHRLISPAHNVYKTYEATLEGEISDGQLERIRAGITLGDGTVCLPARVRRISQSPTVVLVQIRQGKYHQVKRMFAAAGSAVTALNRTAIGALRLDGRLVQGEARLLCPQEAGQVFLDID